MAIAQTSMMAAALAILIYITVIVTGSFTTRDGFNKAAFITQQLEGDSTIHEQISTNPNYVHKSDVTQSSSTILLNGITLHNDEFILLYDSTPFASKGHIALNLPCDEINPQAAMFRMLIGRAPDLTPVNPGYIEEISAPPGTCVYHAQLGFGDPVTDIALKNVSGGEITFRGPHTVVISVHEFYIPTEPSSKDIQHNKGY